ncbi:putative EF-hand domain-containing protein [Helianthus anomalus]
MINSVDADGDGFIDLQEFIELYMKDVDSNAVLESLRDAFSVDMTVVVGVWGWRQWRTQKLFDGCADEVFNHIFKGCGRVFLPKIYTNFFSRGAAAHPDHSVGPPMGGGGGDGGASGGDGGCAVVFREREECVNMKEKVCRCVLVCVCVLVYICNYLYIYILY